ncbi:uncharacterized protein EDB91DRAFT_234720 [Suillus paluster]|uniref:uncharacterized protein n=1 Tax=Suillus paluster TaxID=48578 RepID=UPI001B867272|nr:uncharacterized protein EDB91DRAFT_234720 [Suillus paluster]KAG1743202.1 hypothetical protein EDB91DRAFT_234720 [Suillus paluster]
MYRSSYKFVRRTVSLVLYSQNMSFHQWNSSAASAIPSASQQQHHHPHPGYTSLAWSAAHARPPFYPHTPYGLPSNTSASPHLPHPLPVANTLANMHHFVQAPYSPAAASFTPSNPLTDITPTAVNNTAPTTTTRTQKRGCDRTKIPREETQERRHDFKHSNSNCMLCWPIDCADAHRYYGATSPSFAYIHKSFAHSVEADSHHE